MERLIVDVRAGPIGVITDEVLDLSHDVLRLDALDLGHAHLGGQKRVFAESVIAAAKFQVAVNIHKGLQGDVDAECAVFAADYEAVLLGYLAAEGCRHAHGGSLTLRGMARKNTGRPVGETQPWNAETRNAGKISCLALIGLVVLARAVDQSQLLLKRHVAQQFVYSGVASNDRYALRQYERRAQRQNIPQHGQGSRAHSFSRLQ
jgi:hypothetical protein